MFNSEIFKFDDVTNAKGLHVQLKGDSWTARDIYQSDLSFLQSIFSHPEVMANFGDGKIRTPESVEVRVQNSIDCRFGQGHPHGLLTVVDTDTSMPLMHAIAGGGDRPGTAEIAYAMPLEQQGKGLGSKVVGAIVNEWAPEVSRIGHGIGLDESAQPIINAFQSFGGKALEQLDATSGPKNVPSCRILQKSGFKNAHCDLNDKEPLKDFQATGIEDYLALNKTLLSLFNEKVAAKPLTPGTRYSIIDQEGIPRTFSLHNNYEVIKFHFEKKVERPSF